MNFETLKKKYRYYRDLYDYKLLPNSYVMVMLDGRSFSKKIKKHFERPFDKKFIDIMNKTAQYVCENVSGCKIAYVQSDEINLVLYDEPNQDPFFSNRLCKLQSIIASLATSQFNKLMILNEISDLPCTKEDAVEIIRDLTQYEFDCKAWVVPSINEAVASILYRQNDCIRNSREMVAQTYFSSHQLFGKTTDEQMEMVKTHKNVDWEKDFEEGEKYGRFVKKELRMCTNDNGESYVRSFWAVSDAKPLSEEINRNTLQIIIS